MKWVAELATDNSVGRGALRRWWKGKSVESIYRFKSELIVNFNRTNITIYTRLFSPTSPEPCYDSIFRGIIIVPLTLG